MELHW